MTNPGKNEEAQNAPLNRIVYSQAAIKYDAVFPEEKGHEHPGLDPTKTRERGV